MFRSFFTTIFRGSSAVLCAVTIPPADLRSLSLYYYADQKSHFSYPGYHEHRGNYSKELLYYR